MQMKNLSADDDLKEKAKFFKALSEEVRLKILKHLLGQGMDCVCNISSKMKKDQSVIFRHILILKDAGIIETEKRNKFLFCKIKNKEKIKKFLMIKN